MSICYQPCSYRRENMSDTSLASLKQHPDQSHDKRKRLKLVLIFPDNMGYMNANAMDNSAMRNYIKLRMELAPIPAEPIQPNPQVMAEILYAVADIQNRIQWIEDQTGKKGCSRTSLMNSFRQDSTRQGDKLKGYVMDACEAGIRLNRLTYCNRLYFIVGDVPSLQEQESYQLIMKGRRLPNYGSEEDLLSENASIDKCP